MSPRPSAQIPMHTSSLQCTLRSFQCNICISLTIFNISNIWRISFPYVRQLKLCQSVPPQLCHLPHRWQQEQQLLRQEPAQVLIIFLPTIEKKMYLMAEFFSDAFREMISAPCASFWIMQNQDSFCNHRPNQQTSICSLPSRAGITATPNTSPEILRFPKIRFMSGHLATLLCCPSSCCTLTCPNTLPSTPGPSTPAILVPSICHPTPFPVTAVFPMSQGILPKHLPFYLKPQGSAILPHVPSP